MPSKIVIRRSYRLKDKPAPKYDYQDYLKVAILTAINSSPPTTMQKIRKQKKGEVIDNLGINAKRKTRSETNKKYDDIFTAVVANAFLMDVKKTPAQYFFKAEKRMAQKRKGEFVELIGPGPEEKDDEDEEDEDVIVVVEKKAKSLEVEVLTQESFECACGQRFGQHSDCHRHIYEEHGDNELNAECRQCGKRLDDIRTSNVCQVCGEFSDNLDDHIASHYRNCTARSAVMECRFCTKQFMTVKQVMEHEQQKHIQKQVKKAKPCYKCNECSVECQTQEGLAMHYSRHMDIHLLCARIAELQYKVQAEKEECPFCRVHVSSRKTFRVHMLKQHYAACKSLVLMNFLPPDQPNPLNFMEVKREVEEMTANAAATSDKMPRAIKQEVKEEVHDDEYPSF
ncbi:unnamed protein product [Caenorhabditis sp. 36 PRJEB53466]|nr:unnamed protein product [Caenorhabditis sp. 36 PRJEB53466]